MPSPGYIPGSLVIPRTFAVRMRWTLANGVKASNVLHAIVPEGTSPDVALANGLFDSIKADIAPLLSYMSTQTNLEGLSIRNLQSGSNVEVDSNPADSPSVAGVGEGFALPEEVAIVVTLRSGQTGPAHRGRIYLPGWSTDALDVDGHIDPVLVGTLVTWGALLISNFTIHGMDLGIAHRGHAEYTNDKGKTVPAEAAGTDRVTTIVVTDNKFDSQRRRK